MDGAELIAAERRRHVEEKGITPEQDDGHTRGELAFVAALLVSWHLQEQGLSCALTYSMDTPDWPKQEALHHQHKHDAIGRLTVAGAMIAAEIDRLERLKKAAEVAR